MLPQPPSSRSGGHSQLPTTANRTTTQTTKVVPRSNEMSNNEAYSGPPARKKFAVEGGTAAEIASGARRFAQELQEFMEGNLVLSSDESIVDLQLATCRKLREVSERGKGALW